MLRHAGTSALSRDRALDRTVPRSGCYSPGQARAAAHELVGAPGRRRGPRFLRAQKQNPRHVWRGFCGIKTLAMTYSRMGKATLPSARVRFTSEFGMGSGGSTPLWSPGRGWRVAVEGATLSEVTGHAFRRERNKLDVASSECRDVSRSQGCYRERCSSKPLEVIWSSHTDH